MPQGGRLNIDFTSATFRIKTKSSAQFAGERQAECKDQMRTKPARLDTPAYHRAGAEPSRTELSDRQVLDAMAAAVYVTDAAGRITYYNEAAASLWGHRPPLGQAKWCGSWRLYWPDGRPLPHDQCPMAVTLREGRPVRGVEAIAERPDGTRVPFIPYPTPVHDASGRLVGAVNMLVDVSDRRDAERAAQQLSAIVESADDAIVAKDLNGVITSWNSGAERLFGYTADEAIGKPVTLLIPDDRLDEEPEILRRIRAGERTQHFDTIRRRKDGSLVEIGLTISPIRDAQGRIVGASKVARDITERRRAAEQLNLLLNEMQHRTKNLATVLDAIARQSRPKDEPAVDAFVEVFLGRAHALLSTGELVVASSTRQADLSSVLAKVLEPFCHEADGSRISIEGPPLLVSEQTAGGLALALHELATNGLKYGALKSANGRVSIKWTVQSAGERDQVHIEWKETGGEEISTEPTRTGFGSRVIRSAVSGEPGGETELAFERDGLRCGFAFTTVSTTRPS
jgi:PAS domain S-box-containing protein